MTESRSLRTLLDRWKTAVADSDALQPPVLAENVSDIAATNIVEHTGEVIEGSIFVARVRTGTDGHPYIPQAIEAGAKVIIGERPISNLPISIPEGVVYLQTNDSAEATAWLAAAWHNFPGEQLHIIGITGTNGKTTTGAILFGILREAGFKCGLITTIRAVFGDKEEPTGLHVTTPAAPQLQGYLRRMVDSGLTHCVIETTSHGLAQHRVTAIPYEYALLTNISHEHIDYHGTFEAYTIAKRRLFEIASQHKNGTLVLNSDDRTYEDFHQIISPNQLSYGQRLKPDGQKPTAWASNIEFLATSTSFDLHFEDPPQSIRLFTELLGEFNVSNALCAAVTARNLGVDAENIAAGIASVKSVSGRMERIHEGQSFLTIVDFAHTPDSLEKAILSAKTMLAQQKEISGRVIAVFGSAGKRDIEKRRLMAEVSAQHADVTILTAEDPRTESLEDILEMMAAGCRAKGGQEGVDFWRVPDRGDAIFMGLTLAKPADILLICGKGHEQSMCFGTTEYPWDDRTATRTALRAFLENKPMPNLGLPTSNSAY